MQHVNIMASLLISVSRPSSRLTKGTKEQKPGDDKMNNKIKRVCAITCLQTRWQKSTNAFTSYGQRV